MPRCQWCRQESQNPDVCDWCKRPLQAGWTPAAAPADRMTFAADPDDAPRGDRLLVLSVVGILIMTAIAVALNMSHRKPLPAVPPAAPPIPAVQQPLQPKAEPTPQASESQPSGPSDPPPTTTQMPPAEDDSVAQQPSTPPPAPVPAGGARNPKIAGMRDAIIGH